MYKKGIIALLTVLLLLGCGRKEAPQVIAEGPRPSVASLQHVLAGNSLKIDVRLAGGSAGVGYQVDRAQIDPHCKCPSFWRRAFEEYPHPDNASKKLSKLINLRSHKVAYAFRIRAVDGLGRLSPWSKPIYAQAEEFFK